MGRIQYALAEFMERGPNLVSLASNNFSFDLGLEHEC